MRGQAARAARVVVDLGAGDGRLAYRLARAHGDWLCVAVDASADRLREVSSRAARRPARGGAPNLLCLRASLARLPVGLTGLADEILITFPWGSLLRAVLVPEPAPLAAVARVGRPGATLRVVANASAVQACLAAGPVDAETLRLRLAPGFAAAGIQLAEVVWADVVPTTTWGRRLNRGRPVRAVRITGVVGGQESHAGPPT